MGIELKYTFVVLEVHYYYNYSFINWNYLRQKIFLHVHYLLDYSIPVVA
jgi:hypothetical protein